MYGGLRDHPACPAWIGLGLGVGVGSGLELGERVRILEDLGER